MEPLEGNGKYKFSATKTSKKKTIKAPNMGSVMHRNGFFSEGQDDWYNTVNRYSWIDYRTYVQFNREYLFFTKPDLYIMNGDNLQNAELNSSLKEKNAFFDDAFKNHKEVLGQLQYSINDSNGRATPFMFLLTNAVTSNLDLPGISAESHESTTNIYGTSITYRTHSLKSDNGYDFTLSFSDTKSLEVYTLVKAYDEYMRLNKTGQINISKPDESNPKEKSKAKIYRNYIINKIIPEQFSIYKFIIADDGETIVYYAKATGCYFTDVPRAEFGDPQGGVLKFSVSFHANFIEDNNPLILTEFNDISLATNGTPATTAYSDIWTADGINNEWVMFPCIRAYSDSRSSARGVNKDYRLKWTNVAKGNVQTKGTTKLYGPYTVPGNNSGILENLIAKGNTNNRTNNDNSYTEENPSVVDVIGESVVDTIGESILDDDFINDDNSFPDTISSSQPNLGDGYIALSTRIGEDGQTISFSGIFDYNQTYAQEIYNNTH